MNIPSHLLEKYKLASSILEKSIDRRTERGEIVLQLMEVLNRSRKGKYPPLTFPRMGLMLPKEIPTKDLYALLALCKESGELANNKRRFAKEEEKKKMDTYDSAFSKKFYWEIRAKK